MRPPEKRRNRTSICTKNEIETRKERKSEKRERGERIYTRERQLEGERKERERRTLATEKGKAEQTSLRSKASQGSMVSFDISSDRHLKLSSLSQTCPNFPTVAP